MASETIDLELRGLYLSPNNMSGVPQGALEVADNVVINSKNLITSRRGQTQYGTLLSISSGDINKYFNYASSLIVSFNNQMAYDSDGNGTWVTLSGTYIPPGTDFKIRSMEALRNFYFTSSAGIWKMDSLSATPRLAGVPPALGGTGTLNGSSGFMSTNTAVAYRMVLGYTDANSNLLLGAPSSRVTVANASGGTRNVSLVFSLPGTLTTQYFYQIYRSVATLASTDTPSDEMQLVLQAFLTSAQIAAASFTALDTTPFTLMGATLYTSPSQQGIENANYPPPLAFDMDVYQTYAFYANVVNPQRLSLTIIAVTSPSFGYDTEASAGTTSTSKTITGIASTTILKVGMRVVGSNIPANTIITALASGTTVTINNAATGTGTVSLEFQDRFSINLVDYWAGSTNDHTVNQFQAVTGGTPAANIAATSLNLVNLINLTASVYAYYTSAITDLPGQILFQAPTLGTAAFNATSTNGSSFSPVLPNIAQITAISIANPTHVTSVAHGLTTGNTISIYGSNSTPSINGNQVVTVLTSDTFTVPFNVTVAGTAGYWVLTTAVVQSNSAAAQNQVMISQPGQVDAVPAFQFFNIGSANFPIKRVIALRDGIYFFKNDGIFILTGLTFASFVVTLLDNTVLLKVPESAVAFNNQIFCFTTQGVCAVTSAGVQVISIPIENTLLQLSSVQYPNFVTASFGIAYESERLYIFGTVTQVADTYATQAFVYNSLTASWTRWVFNRTCGIVNTTVNKLFMGQPLTGQTLIERKNFDNSDYADEQYAVTINSIDTTTQMTLADASNVQANDTILQNFRQAFVVSISGNVLTVDTTFGFITGAATAYQAILSSIQWAPINAGNPGVLKQFSEVTFFFRNAAFAEIDAGFSSNIYTSVRTVPLLNSNQGGWGLGSWGGAPWGGVLQGQRAIRTYVPGNASRCNWLFISLQTFQAFQGFSLQGLSLIYNLMSSRFR